MIKIFKCYIKIASTVLISSLITSQKSCWTKEGGSSLLTELTILNLKSVLNGNRYKISTNHNRYTIFSLNFSLEFVVNES